MEGFEITEAPAVEGFEPTSETVDTSTDSSAAESTESAENGEETPESVDNVDGQPQGQQPNDGRLVVDGKLSAAAKATIEKLKTENPTLAKAIQRALFTEDRLRRELPGGFKDLETLRGQIEQLGGDTGIQELQQETNGWREFDQLYTAGDPKVLEFLTETPEAKDAFLKIAPAAFEKFREANPEGYNSYVAQVFVADLTQNGIPLLIERLYDFMPADNPRAKEALDRLAAYVNRIHSFSQKPVAPPAQPKPEQDQQRAREIEQREQNLTRQEWGRETGARHSSMFQAAWKQQIGDRKLSPDQVATIRELYGLKLSAILKARADFNQNLERYFASGQKEGFLRHFEATYKEAVPRALRTAIQQAGIGGKPGPKGGAQQQPKPGQQQQKQAPKPPASGFTFVNAKPAMNLVDRSATSTDMWLNGKAVLKDGKRVQWKT